MDHAEADHAPVRITRDGGDVVLVPESLWKEWETMMQAAQRMHRL